MPQTARALTGGCRDEAQDLTPYVYRQQFTFYVRILNFLGLKVFEASERILELKGEKVKLWLTTT
jgi:hypothetical protein